MALDKKNTRSVNIAYPLKWSSRGAFKTNEDTVSAIADDLRILLLTNYGERPIHYDFGANLRALLFENFASGDLPVVISDAVIVAVERWLPFVIVEDVLVKTSDEDPSLSLNEAKVEVKFRVGQTNLTGDVAVRVKA